jgi:hypothetical protein
VLKVPLKCNEWQSCWGTLYTNDLRNNFGGPCWKNIFGGGGNWNDCISSIYVVNNSPWTLCVTAYNDPNFTGLSQRLTLAAGKAGGISQVRYNDLISSIDISVHC